MRYLLVYFNKLYDFLLRLSRKRGKVTHLSKVFKIGQKVLELNEKWYCFLVGF